MRPKGVRLQKKSNFSFYAQNQKKQKKKNWGLHTGWFLSRLEQKNQMCCFSAYVNVLGNKKIFWRRKFSSVSLGAHNDRKNKKTGCFFFFELLFLFFL